jgi:methyltransferase-like protein
MNSVNDVMNETGAKVFRRNEDVVSRNISGELFLVPVKGKLADMQRIFTLNSVAEYIWQELDGKKSLDDVCNGVMERFEVGREDAESDIGNFISELLRAGLIEEQE